MSVILFVLVALIGLVGCQPVTSPEDAPRAREFAVQVRPSTAAPGQVRTFSFQAAGAGWRPGEVAVELGEGLSPVGITVRSEYRMEVSVMVDRGAQLGPRDVSLRWPDGEQTLDDAIIVEPGAVSLEPARALLGESLRIHVQGFDTEFVQGQTWASFDDEHVEVWNFDVHSPTSATMELVVASDAQPGFYDCFVFSGGTTWSLHGGLRLDRTWQGATFSPPQGYQGRTIAFDIQGSSTAFREGFTEVDLGTGIQVDLGEEVLEDPNDFYEVSPGRVRGFLTLANAAPLGLRDVWVTTYDEAGRVAERVLIPDAFEVLYVPPDVTRARGSLSIRQSARWDPDACDWRYTTSATALFYEPVNPPCRAGPGTGVTTFSAPPRYDVSSYGTIAIPGVVDCPAPQTFDVGPWVAFESASQILTLDRRENAYTGRIDYAAAGLTEDDYIPANTYDIRVPGSQAPNGLAAFFVPEVIDTLPARYTVLSPNVCEQDTFFTDEPFPVEWTLSYTYDEQDFYLRLSGPAGPDGTPTMMVYPYDDGEWSWSPEQLATWPDGGARFYAVASDFKYWTLPANESTGAGFSSTAITHRTEMQFQRPEM